MQRIAERLNNGKDFFVGTLGGFFTFFFVQIERSQPKLIGWVSKLSSNNLFFFGGGY